MQTDQAAPPPAALPNRPAKWLPLIGLLAVMTFVTLGGFLFSGSPADTALGGDVEVGPALHVTEEVAIQPAAGWGVAGPIDDPSFHLRGIVLEGSNGRLLVGALDESGSPEEAVDFYVSGYLEPQASQLSVGNSEPVSLPAGPAVAAPYVGVFEGVATPIEGEVIAIVSPSGILVVLDGWASQGNYSAVQDQVAAMAASVSVL